MNDLRVCRPDGTELLTKRLDPVRSYWIGRDAHCDIVIENPSVSRRHAVMFNTSGHWFISDCGSLEGLDCSLGKTRCLRMTSEAYVQIADPVFWVMGGPANPPEWIDTRAERLDGASPLMARLGNESLTERARAAPKELLVIADAQGGIQLCADLSQVISQEGSGSARITIGRANTMDVQLCHASVDPLHCVMVRGAESWSLIDAGSSCGINYDGKRWFRKRFDEGITLPVGDFRFSIQRLTHAKPALPPAMVGREHAARTGDAPVRRSSVFLGEPRSRSQSEE